MLTFLSFVLPHVQNCQQLAYTLWRSDCFGAIKLPFNLNPSKKICKSAHNTAKPAKMGSTMPNTRQIRKSISGGSPRKTKDQKNATMDVGSTLRGNRKKLRSKSMGPGGLDALKIGSGNRRTVCSLQFSSRCSLLVQLGELTNLHMASPLLHRLDLHQDLFSNQLFRFSPTFLHMVRARPRRMTSPLI